MAVVPTSLQRSSRVSSRRPAPIHSGSEWPRRSIISSTPTPFVPVVQAKLRIGAPSDKYKQEADSNAHQGADRVANEIDLPQDQGASTTFFPHGDSSGSITNSEQEQNSPTCFEPSGPMTKVTSGRLHGKLQDGSELSTLDYFPDQRGKGTMREIRTAGPFVRDNIAAANVQLYGTILSACRPELFSLRQTVTYTVDKEDGVSTAKEGTSVDDIKESGKDASKAPFRQDWLDDEGYHISMADVPGYYELGRAAFSSYTNIELVKDFVTSLVGSAGETSVNWSYRLKIEDGKVIENEVT
jgi:hypothetical protein